MANWSTAREPDFQFAAEYLRLFSRIVLFSLLVLLISKFGVFTRLRRLKPRLDRGVNLIIGGLVVIYVGHLLWWLVFARGAH